MGDRPSGGGARRVPARPMGRRLAWFLVIVALLAAFGGCHALTRTLAPGEPNYCHAVSSYKWPECNR